MREQARIKRILDKVAALWSASPDLRFGQLVESTFHAVHPTDDAAGCIYNIEDNEVERILDVALRADGNT